MTPAKKERLLVIGIDGATWQLLSRWMADGSLPNLKRMAGAGARGTLQSTVIPNSFPGWTTCTTGVNPAKHGIFKPLIRKDLHSYEMAVVSARDVKTRRVWDILGAHGKKVGVMNVPCTYPPEPVKGFLIGGMLSPGLESDFAYPPEIMREVLTHVDDYVIDLKSKQQPRTAMRDQLLYSVKARADAACYLMRAKPWDFFMVVFTETDRGQHYFWADMDESHLAHTPARFERFGDVIHRVYSEVDRAVGRLLECIDERTLVLVVSDHGFGPQNHVVHLNKWLADEGYLRLLRKEALAAGLKNKAKKALRAAGMLEYARTKKQEWSRAELKHAEGGPQLKRSIVEDAIARIDWPRTRVYSLVPRGIRLNVRGREPQGIVDPGREYQQLREEIRGRLAALTFPNSDEPVFEQVLFRDECMSGAMIEYAPDILTQMKVGVPSCQLGTENLFEVNAGVTGSHIEEGMLIGYGFGVRAGAVTNGAQLQDVTPTALFSLNTPLSEEMDGRVLTEMFTEEFAASREIKYEGASAAAAGGGKVYESDEEKDILDQLAGLGYIS